MRDPGWLAALLVRESEIFGIWSWPTGTSPTSAGSRYKRLWLRSSTYGREHGDDPGSVGVPAEIPDRFRLGSDGPEAIRCAT